MCGRFFLDADFDEIYQKFFLGAYEPMDIRRGDYLPTDLSVVVLDEPRKVARMHWGLEGYEKNQKLINARQETLLEKPRFEPLMQAQRCIVPATGFYEWEKRGKERFKHFVRTGASISSFAAIYEILHGEAYFAIITTAAEGAVKDIHDRMPFALSPEDIDMWLSKEVSAEQAQKLLKKQKEKYFFKDPETQLSFF